MGIQGVQNLRILLVEDSLDNQHLLRLILKRAGADVSIANHGQEAIDRVQIAAQSGLPIDVILMDMQMPVLDGYAATSALRESGFAGTIIALTAHACNGDRRRCLAAGCDEYVAKPVDRELLFETIQRLAGASSESGRSRPASP